MFPTSGATAPFSGLTTVGDRHIMAARSPSVGILSRATRFPGAMFSTLGVSPAGRLGLNL